MHQALNDQHDILNEPTILFRVECQPVSKNMQHKGPIKRLKAPEIIHRHFLILIIPICRDDYLPSFITHPIFGLNYTNQQKWPFNPFLPVTLVQVMPTLFIAHSLNLFPFYQSSLCLPGGMTTAPFPSVTPFLSLMVKTRSLLSISQWTNCTFSYLSRFFIRIATLCGCPSSSSSLMEASLESASEEMLTSNLSVVSSSLKDKREEG